MLLLRGDGDDFIVKEIIAASGLCKLIFVDHGLYMEMCEIKIRE